MTYNLVTVSINLTDITGSPLSPEGISAGLAFEVSDMVWDTAAGSIVFVPPVEISTLGYTTPTITVDLLAMDNETISQNWAWLVAAGVAGQPVPVRKLTVAYANGVTQNLATLLEASVLA